jgi:hypothetical protein
MHHANISLLLHSLDPMNEEPELEVQAEQVQAELTPSPSKANPVASHHNPWLFELISLC